ncbi:hypothetical protein QYS49_27410 [Marivirga salinae]|uniref:Uncharacterized protein n=1 Tax=Marivirga salinarum TaxID=3059078 RepID=A0AA49GGH8_9BACT|nr:hypothetical protein [Marivirga sp. BDSF4-3]WKK75256.2 hypothetical protein QYS49_27410 [Marivirga sp. BDSF4-3]
MNNFNYKGRNLTSGPHLLGILLIIAGLFALMSPVLFKNGSSIEKSLALGIGVLIVGFVIVSSYSGTLIDFSGKRVKEYTSISGYVFGKWTAFPNISVVRVISSTSTSTNIPNGISPTLSRKVTIFKVLMYSNAPKPVLSFVYSKKVKAVEQAKTLANNLNSDLVLDIT